MYRPKLFAEDNLDVLHDFIRAHPLGNVITGGANGLMANLIPVSLYAEGEKGTLRLHLARANPQVASLASESEVLVTFGGAEAYVTPRWYPTKQVHGKVVPTWNYAVVQVYGKPKVIDNPAWLLAQIGELTNAHEAESEHPWQVSDAPDDYVQNQLKAIIGVEILVERIEGKFKVSQNQPEANWQSVAEHFQQAGHSEMAQMVAERGASDRTSQFR